MGALGVLMVGVSLVKVAASVEQRRNLSAVETSMFDLRFGSFNQTIFPEYFKLYRILYYCLGY